jgi:hypothetical protein
VNRRPVVLLRLRVGGHGTSAGVSRADNRWRRGGRSPGSGLWRAGSGSRRSMRPSRRTGTSTARPSVARVPGSVDTSWRTARHRRRWLRERTGAWLRCDCGGAARVASNVLSVWDRARVVASSELPAGIGRNEQHVQRSSPQLMTNIAARPRDGDRARHRQAMIGRGGVTPRRY